MVFILSLLWSSSQQLHQAFLLELNIPDVKFLKTFDITRDILEEKKVFKAHGLDSQLSRTKDDNNGGQ